MNAKTITTVVLLGFVGVSVVYLVAKEIRGGANLRPAENAPAAAVQPGQAPAAGAETGLAAPAPAAAAAAARHNVVAYYFFGNYRCATCRAIESYAHEALQSTFVEALADGQLEWRPVNIDQPENAHFVQDYQLATRSLVIVQFDGERQTTYKNLERVWELVRDKEAFMKYVVEETDTLLKAG